MTTRSWASAPVQEKVSSPPASRITTLFTSAALKVFVWGPWGKVLKILDAKFEELSREMETE